MMFQYNCILFYQLFRIAKKKTETHGLCWLEQEEASKQSFVYHTMKASDRVLSSVALLFCALLCIRQWSYSRRFLEELVAAPPHDALDLLEVLSEQRKPRLIVHVGPPKTATTTIQWALGNSR